MAELLQAFMYPMSWGHVYVPVLPRGLFDVIKAPMPFLLGTNTEWMDAQFYEDVLNQGNYKNYFFCKKRKNKFKNQNILTLNIFFTIHDIFLFLFLIKSMMSWC